MFRCMMEATAAPRNWLLQVVTRETTPSTVQPSGHQDPLCLWNLHPAWCRPKASLSSSSTWVRLIFLLWFRRELFIVSTWMSLMSLGVFFFSEERKLWWSQQNIAKTMLFEIMIILPWRWPLWIDCNSFESSSLVCFTHLLAVPATSRFKQYMVIDTCQIKSGYT